MQTKQKSNVNIPKKVASRAKVTIITSLYNRDITQSLENHCLKTLREFGVNTNQIKTFKVPGALEIPITAQLVAGKIKPDIIIALGCVIKGETYHFEVVVDECARGCQRVSLDLQIPVIFEVIPAFNIKQAKARSANNLNNKGREAAIAALEMLITLDSIKNAKSNKKT